ncbi:5-formyltetrahydrofolate cyclo-ligase [Winogradskyella alexanderae]|uniref:5-formyltetrahydrofolate cyclo-ligase n=1 Tax=Winogradskyella alexanderae TaxID=2877123 RepID=A0ABS7XPZ9_9FLAO|nr:5-formyltetrahydrofolate cyclo-ligase [Winogradskyella alexanderae]MCA0131469.1 5-formyltetrahydrofolate cyclo-ligase [Winogradskyella alexanderae]
MTKQELRKKYKQLRQNLTKNEIEEKSLAIANQLLESAIWDYSFYHIFLPIEEQNEINTEYILNILAGKDKNIIVSKSNFSDISMSHFLLTDNTRFKKNKYNIPEPISGISIESKSIDVVFIPLLAYDVMGNRIGYGKGFYDRFLASCKPEIIKIGLSLFNPEKEIINTTIEDITLDYCVTPNSIYKFE